MRFLLVVLFAACSAACGNNGIDTRVSYSNYTSVAIKGGIIGGSVQGTPLPLVAKDIHSTTVSTIAGTVSERSSDHDLVDGVGAAARFDIANGITTDGNNLYVTDYGNHAIRRINIATQTVTTIAGVPGDAGSNTSDATLTGVPGNRAYFDNPSGITTDGTNLYVTDYNNHTIRQIVIASGIVTTIAGGVGIVGAVDAAVGTDARFYWPIDITTDRENLYVSDFGNLTIRKISLTPPYAVTTVAGSPDKNGANPPVGAPPVSGRDARFRSPARITTDGTNLYVADVTNNTISKIDGVSHKVSTIAGTARVTGSADGIGAAASFGNVNGITSDGTNLYVTDSNNNTVRKVVPLPDGTWSVVTIAGTASTGGNSGVGSTDGPGDKALFKYPIGITTDGTALYVTDSNNYTIRKIQ